MHSVLRCLKPLVIALTMLAVAWSSMQRHFAYVLFLSVVFNIASASTAVSQQTILRDQLVAMRIAHPQSLPPIVEVHDGKSVGLAVDILRAAAARAGINLLFVPVTIEQQMSSLTDGRADALYTAVTPERRQLLDFSSPVLTTGGGLFVRTPNHTPESLAVLSGKVVVTPRAGPLAAFIQKTAPDVKLVVTADYEESLVRIVRGEADAAALNFQAGARIAARLYPGQVTGPRDMFIQTPQAVGVLKGQSAKFIAQLDVGLAAIRADGTWQQINDRWGADVAGGGK